MCSVEKAAGRYAAVMITTLILCETPLLEAELGARRPRVEAALQGSKRRAPELRSRRDREAADD